MQAVAPLEKVMKRFVMRQNIEHYRALLRTSLPTLRSGAALSSCFTTKKPSSKNTTRITRRIAQLQQDGLIDRA